MVQALVKWLLPFTTYLIQAFVLFLSAFFFNLFYFPTVFRLFSEILKCWKAFWRKILKLAMMALCCYTIFFAFVKKKQNQECNVCNFIVAVLWHQFCVLVHSVTRTHVHIHTQAIFLKLVHPSPLSWLC